MQPTDKLTTKHAADYLGVHKVTVSNWRNRNRGPEYIKIQGRVYYERSVLDRFKETYVVKGNDTVFRQNMNMTVVVSTRAYIDVLAAERGVSLGRAVDLIVADHMEMNSEVQP